jgi:hypothetical protein
MMNNNNNRYSELLNKLTVLNHQNKRIEIELPSDFTNKHPDFSTLRDGECGIRLGGSEVCVAMGYGSFKTRRELWTEKIAIKEWYENQGKPEERPERVEGKFSIQDDDRKPLILLEGAVREEEMRLIFSQLTGYILKNTSYWTFEDRQRSILYGVLPDSTVFKNISPPSMDLDDSESIILLKFLGPLELKVSINKPSDSLKLEHACQCFYQMFLTNSKSGFYMNCHWTEMRVTELGYVKDAKESDWPNKLIVFELYWNNAFWAFMWNRLTTFMDHILSNTLFTEGEEDEEKEFELPPTVYGRDIITCEEVSFCWERHKYFYRYVFAYPKTINNGVFTDF